MQMMKNCVSLSRGGAGAASSERIQPKKGGSGFAKLPVKQKF